MEEDRPLPFCGSVAEIGGSDFWDAEALVAPYYPSKQEVVSTIIRAIHFEPDDVLYDLGCGDGRVLFEAVSAGCPKAVGVELDSELVALINEKATSQSGRIFTVEGDLLTADFSEATVLYLYLFPRVLATLQEKVDLYMRTGKLRMVMTNSFDFPALNHHREKNEQWNYVCYTRVQDSIGT